MSPDHIKSAKDWIGRSPILEPYINTYLDLKNNPVSHQGLFLIYIVIILFLLTDYSVSTCSNDKLE